MARRSRCGLALEEELHRQGFRRVAGVDEVGRGALFGPVVAAAVIIDGPAHPALDDSKLLTPAARKELALWVMKRTRFAVASASVAEIDRYNIRIATFEAMTRALRLLDPAPDFVLVDGYPISRLDLPQEGVIGGDRTSASIAAASIVAKVMRDHLMRLYAERFPCYNLGQNKGYGSVMHKEAIQRFGLTEHHRRSFCGSLDNRQLALGYA
ncbi:MAG: ribonuclease HII [Acidobacteriota bacterium]